ncbi:MAG: hypothetical protein QM775_04285 [Pirellulales bacterium]
MAERASASVQMIAAESHILSLGRLFQEQRWMYGILTATIQLRGASYRAIFGYQGRQHAVIVGEVSKAEVNQWAAKIDPILMRLK